MNYLWGGDLMAKRNFQSEILDLNKLYTYCSYLLLKKIFLLMKIFSDRKKILQKPHFKSEIKEGIWSIVLRSEKIFINKKDTIISLVGGRYAVKCVFYISRVTQCKY